MNNNTTLNGDVDGSLSSCNETKMKERGSYTSDGPQLKSNSDPSGEHGHVNGSMQSREANEGLPLPSSPDGPKSPFQPVDLEGIYERVDRLAGSGIDVAHSIRGSELEGSNVGYRHGDYNLGTFSANNRDGGKGEEEDGRLWITEHNEIEEVLKKDKLIVEEASTLRDYMIPEQSKTARLKDFDRGHAMLDPAGSPYALSMHTLGDRRSSTSSNSHRYNSQLFDRSGSLKDIQEVYSPKLFQYHQQDAEEEDLEDQEELEAIKASVRRLRDQRLAVERLKSMAVKREKLLHQLQSDLRIAERFVHVNVTVSS
jgi:hypothetical protein